MNSSLEGRSELKYALPVSMRGAVLAAVDGHVVPGAHAASLADAAELRWARCDPPPFGYYVHSLYLDSPRLDGYARRLAEADIRNRQRIRTYGQPGDDAPVFLEAKRKLRERVVKHRVPVGGALAWATGDPDHPWRAAVDRIHGGRDRRLAQRWLAITEAAAMIPVCVTHYTREVYEDGTARLTLDHAVMATAGGDPRQLHRRGQVPLLPADWMVLELKFYGC
ncbi:MAG: VTC domain-containing protein [Oligoflexia bacterium]|nr:VTC domain-containing protein [Oligoflexia bacterium]